jgi:hypothetical protein
MQAAAHPIQEAVATPQARLRQALLPVMAQVQATLPPEPTPMARALAMQPPAVLAQAMTQQAATVPPQLQLWLSLSPLR